MFSKILAITLLSLSTIALSTTTPETKDSKDYRLVLGVASDHSRIDGHQSLNSKHKAIGIAKSVDLSSLDNEYIGVINFVNSYHNRSTALSYEAGVKKYGLTLGGRALLIHGYNESEDQLKAYFLSDDISFGIQPFARFEHDFMFVEFMMVDVKVPALSFGTVF